jgi:hypothetical protein
LLHGEETHAFGDDGYQGIAKLPDANADVTWHVAMRSGKRRALNKENAVDDMIDKVEKIKSEEKHGTTRRTVCAVEFMDGSRQTYENTGMSAPETRGNAPKRLQTSLMSAKNGATLKGCT